MEVGRGGEGVCIYLLYCSLGWANGAGEPHAAAARHGTKRDDLDGHLGQSQTFARLELGCLVLERDWG